MSLVRSRLRKKMYQMGGYVADPVGLGTSDEERKSEQATKAGIGVVTAINPIVGAGLGLGTLIGNMTTDNNGIYKSKSSEIIDNNVNPVTGVKNVLDIFKGKMDSSSLLNFATGGMFGTSKRQREKEAALEAQRKANLNKFNSFLTNRSDQILADYDLYGSKDQTSLYQMGGQLKPINSDTVEVEGPSHAEGGVQLGGNNEVEGNETIADDYVFSDFLGFADRHKKIARQIGKIEKKPLNNERRVSLEILRKKEEALKERQEQVKSALLPQQGKFQMGGRLIDLTTGQGYTEPTGVPPTPSADRNYAQQPLTLDEMRYTTPNRDWDKYPLTKEEIQGWTNTLKQRHLEFQRKMAPKLDLTEHRRRLGLPIRVKVDLSAHTDLLSMAYNKRKQ